jgi:hypothetical protein
MPGTALRGARALLTRVGYVVAFFLFDREAGRVRLHALTGLGVVALAVWSHLWLSGPWMLQAGFHAVTSSATAAAALPTPAAARGEGSSHP